MKRIIIKLFLEIINLIPICIRYYLFGPFYYIFHRYEYNFTISQLIEITKLLQETLKYPGKIVEIGCANGRTTVFLNHYLDCKNKEIKDKQYYCIDTFSGFVKTDVEIEVKNRGKSAKMFKNEFVFNSKRWFEKTMKQNSINRVVSIKADVNQFNFEELLREGGISFCLLDVDLYKPTKHSLKELYKLLVPGGIIVVDDCNPNDKRWDGAFEAYTEFLAEINQPLNIIEQKLGIIRKGV